ncbi:MAG: sulfotransferase family protein [Pseudonocardiaceae bacterium]
MNESAHEGVVETLLGTWAPLGSRPIELVFHTGGESTSELALALALAHIKPDCARVIHDPQRSGLAARRRFGIDHRYSHIVSVDAGCLILEDLRPFLDANELPFVGCYGRDRFRGLAQCGVHITRLDVVEAMCTIPEPVDSIEYLLSPEEYLRRIALRQRGFESVFKNFHILSDYLQRSGDVFVKYVLRGLRARIGFAKMYLEPSMSSWGQGVDFDVARHALDYLANAVSIDATPWQVARYICDLPYLAPLEVQKLGFDPGQSDQISIDDVDKAVASDPVTLGRSTNNFKVFGVGLSRTGTHSLTAALHVLGFDTVHYPTDSATLETLRRGDVRFPLLEYYDGITDITTSPYYEDFDRQWPGSKFVLTVRDEDSWLCSCRKHWAGLSTFRYGDGEEHRVFMEVRRFLEAAVYASYKFDEEHFRRVYRRHIQNVTNYFAGRECDLLVLNVVAGDGYELLAPFLGVPVPVQPFPHRGTKGKLVLTE